MHLVLDCETTGFPHWTQPYSFPLQARACQIACILIDDDWKERGSFSSLIIPDGWTISSGAQGAHGITEQDCRYKGIPIKSALGVIIAFMAQVDYIVCHGIKFDGFILNTELQHAGCDTYDLETQGICTLKTSRKVCELRNISKRGPGLNLQELHKELLGENFIEAHDALADVRATARCFEKMCELELIELPTIVQ